MAAKTLEDPHRFSPEEVTIVRAINVLGAGKVVTAEQAAKAWDRDVPENPVIGYLAAQLREAALANRDQGTDWRLVYLYGISLRDQHQLIGVDTNHQPCFYNNDWWLAGKEDKWAKRQPQGGYYLIDFNGRLAGLTWDNQEQEIAKLKGCRRVDDSLISEAILSIYKTHNERLLENYYHWGLSLDSGRGRVYVGRFDRDGLFVRSYLPDCGSDRLRVCLLRESQRTED